MMNRCLFLLTALVGILSIDATASLTVDRTRTVSSLENNNKRDLQQTYIWDIDPEQQQQQEQADNPEDSLVPTAAPVIVEYWPPLPEETSPPQVPVETATVLVGMVAEDVSNTNTAADATNRSVNEEAVLRSNDKTDDDTVLIAVLAACGATGVVVVVILLVVCCYSHSLRQQTSLAGKAAAITITAQHETDVTETGDSLSQSDDGDDIEQGMSTIRHDDDDGQAS
jgi:hypothetical protein